MAQSAPIVVNVNVEEPIKLLIDLELAAARQRVKRVIREAEEVNRDLARLQEKLGGLSARLAEYGIALEVE